MIPSGTILAIAHLIAVAAEAGLTIQSVMSQVRETGVVPEKEWDILSDALDVGEEFWKDVLNG